MYVNDTSLVCRLQQMKKHSVLVRKDTCCTTQRFGRIIRFAAVPKV